MRNRPKTHVVTFLGGEDADHAFRLFGSYQLSYAVWKALTGSDPPWPKTYTFERQPWRLSSQGGFIDFYASFNLLKSVKGELSMALARSVWLKLEKSGVPCVFISWEEQEAEAEAVRRVVEENNLRILNEPVWSSFEGSDADFWAGVSERNADEAAFADEAVFWERNRELYED